MSHIFYLFATLLALVCGLAWISIWSPRALVVKLSALALAGLLLPLGYASLADLLSRPKPVDFEWAHRDLAEATLLGAKLQEGEAIYLWLGLAEVAEPRSYVLPWDQRLAEQLHRAQREADAKGTGVQVRLPFTRGYDNRPPMFYPLPQPASPPKEIPSAGSALEFHSPAPGRRGL